MSGSVCSGATGVCGSDAGSGWADSRSPMRVQDGVAIDPDGAGDAVGEIFRQPGLPALDSADGLIAGPDTRTELFLGQPGEHTEIGEGALGRRDDHQLIHLDREHPRRPRQQVGLRCDVPGFPPQDRRLVDVREPAEIATTHTGALAGGLQPCGLEAVERAFHADLANIGGHLTIRPLAVIKCSV